MAEAPAYKQPRTAFLRWAAISVSLLLASCAAGPKGKPVVVAPPPPVESPDAGNLPQDQARHRIALLVPLTGPNAAVGQSIANATTMALIDTGNKSVRVTTYDTATGAAAAAQRALTDGNRLFLGPLLSDDAAAVAPAARKAGVPVISYSNDASVAGDGVFAMGFFPAQSIERVVRYAKGRGVQRFAALVPTGDYGRNASTAIIRSVEGAGANLVAMKSYGRQPKALERAVAELGRNQAYDAVLIGDLARVGVALAPMIRKSSSPQARILGTELWATEQSTLRLAVLGGSWYASVSDGRYHQLATAYRRQFGKSPFRLASLGYDSMLLVIKVARDWKIGTPFPADQFGDQEGFVGVDGVFRFNANGVAQRALEVSEASPAGTRTISPAPSSFKD